MKKSKKLKENKIYAMEDRYLWNRDFVQEDLPVLQKAYKKLGYELTLEQCYDVWHEYSNNEDNCSNWLMIEGIEYSETYVKKVLNIKDKR